MVVLPPPNLAYIHSIPLVDTFGNLSESQDNFNRAESCDPPFPFLVLSTSLNFIARWIMKEPDHIMQFTEKKSRCQYCFDEGKKDVKCFTYFKTCNVHICVQKDRNCFKMYHSFWVKDVEYMSEWHSFDISIPSLN